MGSPFPGMDPYLEGDLWQEVHERLANQISAQLMQKIAPKLVGYERLIDYTTPPPAPSLAPDDAAWVDQTLRAAGVRS